MTKKNVKKDSLNRCDCLCDCPNLVYIRTMDGASSIIEIDLNKIKGAINNQDPRLRKTPQYHIKGNPFSWYVNLTISLSRGEAKNIKNIVINSGWYAIRRDYLNK